MSGRGQGRGQGSSRAQSFNQEDPSQRGRRSEQQQTIADRQVSAQTQRSTISNGGKSSFRGGGRGGFGGSRTAKSNTNPSGRVISPRTGKTFGKQQSALAKTVGNTMKSKAGTKGPRQPATAKNAAANNPRARLPNLDDINEEFNNNEGIDGRRYVDYNVYYGTTEAKKNYKDKYKRSKLRKKKSTGLLGELNVTSGNSVLDTYKSLGSRLRA